MTFWKVEKGETITGRSRSTIARLISIKCPNIGERVSEGVGSSREGKRRKRRSQMRTRSGRGKSEAKSVVSHLNT